MEVDLTRNTTEAEVRRRRTCRDCGLRFFTREIPENEVATYKRLKRKRERATARRKGFIID